MGLFKLQQHPESRDEGVIVNGRDYFREGERELGIEGLDPATINRDHQSDESNVGPAHSRAGGDLSHYDLKELDEQEIADRRRRSEEFLKQPVEHFPAEESDS